MQSSNTNKKPFIIFVTGVSGAGKTTFVKALSEKLTKKNIEYLNFDSIGVPSEKEMKKQYGSGTAWQKAMLYQWVEKILTNPYNRDFVLLDGQVNMDFINEACKNYNVIDYSIILVHCKNHLRHERLEKHRE
jgi:uridine kinase